MPRECEQRKPLLTIAIPTYNRAADLARLLDVLLPQAAANPDVEVLVSDNASPDDTPGITAAAQARWDATGAHLRVVRQAENIGADRNFVFCFHQAAGTFFWMCGDDDLIVPGGLDEVVQHLRADGEIGSPAPIDIVYATSAGYTGVPDLTRGREHDPMRRTFHKITDARTFARVVNVMFTFISGMVVNKDRLAGLPHEEPEALFGTNLVQLGWSLPLLLAHRRSVVVWTRPVLARTGDAHGYAIGTVFGANLASTVRRLLPGREDLSNAILHTALRRWLPSVLLAYRADAVKTGGKDKLQLGTAHDELRQTFGRDPRYWLFTWPALRLPLGLAKVYTKGSAVVSKAIYALQIPGFWRKEIR